MLQVYYTLETEMLLTLVLDILFRVLVKVVSGSSESSYTWHEMTFYFRWEPDHCAVLCIGVGPSFQSLLQEILGRIWPVLPPNDPCSLLVPIIEAIIAMYDQSVWSIRDAIRRAEKVSAVQL
jgi:hypothetical protein